MSALAPPMGMVQHPALGPVRYRLDEVSDDPDTQVAQVIGMMRNYAVADSASPEIIRDAYSIVNTYGDPLSGIHRFLRERMGFVHDEETAEPLQSSVPLAIAEVLIRPRDLSTSPVKIGDCDDYVMYGASMLHALNIPCSFVTVAADDREPNAYSHVYLAAYPTRGPYAGSRIPLDCSHGPYAGWEVANRLGKRAEWPLSTSVSCLLGLALVIGGGLALAAQMKGAS
jgi:hypothetical protein